MVPPGVHIFPNLDHVLHEQLGLSGPRDDAARTAAKIRFISPGTTPVIRESVHLQPCSLRAKNSIALSVRGSSAVNSSTRPHKSRATASSRAHSKRMWPMSSSGPSQKIQGWAGITVRLSFGLHRRMICMVDKRLSCARSKFLCVGPWCTAPRGSASHAPANGVWALVRAAKERHSISLTCWRACMVGTCGSSSPSSLGTKRVASSLGNRRCIGGAFAWAAAKSGCSSGTAAKCELCLTTRWCGPLIMRGSRRSPSAIQFNACWLTRCEVGPLMPR